MILPITAYGDPVLEKKAKDISSELSQVKRSD